MYNYRSARPSQVRSSHSDYFRDAENSDGVNAGQHCYFRRPNLTATIVTTAQQLAAVRMSQAGYNSSGSGAGGGGHSMQPSHGAHHQAPTQQQPQQQQSMPPPHAGMTYHQPQQQQSSGPPYVIGPGQYTSPQQQFAYRQQQPSYQQHQSPTQQQQHPGRPAFLGINAIPTSAGVRVPTSQLSSSTPYLVQQQQQNSQSIRMPQQQQQPALSAAMQQSPSQATFVPPRPIAVSSAHYQQPQQQLISGGLVQPQLVRVQQQHQSPQQVLHQAGGNARMVGQGQVQVIATSASGLMMPTQYTGQGVYQQRPVVLQQQPIVVQQLQQQPVTSILSSQQQSQPATIQYQYNKPQQQTTQSQMQQQTPSQQQQPSVLPKQQPTPSPSSASSTPATQFAAPNQVTIKQDSLTSSPSPASISAATSSGPSASSAISDSATGGYLGVQSDSSQVLTKQRLDDLVREVDPYEQLDDDVKDTLLHIADEFIESVVSSACQIAKHRKANAVDVKDVQLCLERNWNMWIPGFGTDDIRPYKKACVTDAHKQRTALIKKTLKKI